MPLSAPALVTLQSKGCFCIKTFQILRLLQSLSFSSQGIEVRLREKGLSYVDGGTEALFVEPEEGVRVDVEVERTDLEEVHITPLSWVCCTLHCTVQKASSNYWERLLWLPCHSLYV